MKLRNGFNFEVLLDYGFRRISQSDFDDDYVIQSYDYQYPIGHSRRGQFYFLLVKESTGLIFVYASEPDGSGGVVECPDVLIKMMKDGLFD